MAFKCRKPKCGRSFASMGKLRAHQWKVHPEAYAKAGRKAGAPTAAAKQVPAPIPDPAPRVKRTYRKAPATPHVVRAAVKQVVTLSLDEETLRAALIGYQAQIEVMQLAKAEIEAQLGMRTPRKGTSAGSTPVKGVHRISPEGKERIREAQRRRWAAKQAMDASPAAPVEEVG